MRCQQACKAGLRGGDEPVMGFGCTKSGQAAVDFGKDPVLSDSSCFNHAACATAWMIGLRSGSRGPMRSESPRQITRASSLRGLLQVFVSMLNTPAGPIST